MSPPSSSQLPPSFNTNDQDRDRHNQEQIHAPYPGNATWQRLLHLIFASPAKIEAGQPRQPPLAPRQPTAAGHAPGGPGQVPRSPSSSKGVHHGPLAPTDRCNSVVEGRRSRFVARGSAARGASRPPDLGHVAPRPPTGTWTPSRPPITPGSLPSSGPSWWED